MARVLVVDDEKDVVEYLENFFQRRGIFVDIAKTGDEALDLFQQHNPDLILLDVKMERMDGLEVLKRIREKNQQVKVIMVTGKQEAFVRRQAEELGIYDYINKPLDLAKLRDVVLEALGQASS